MNRQFSRILFLAVEFPPHKTIGRLRIVKFCLHLQALGWECYVLTVPENPSAPNYDTETLENNQFGLCDTPSKY